MLFLQSNTTDPYINAATEQWLQEQTALPPVFFLYRNSPSIIVGKYQNVYAEVDVAQARKRGIPIVRRCSGGGTVYHDDGNFNLCFVEPFAGPADNLHDRYILPVLQALQRMGIPAHKQRSCDLAIDGKKISGSAQFLRAGRSLHHCTLLFDTDLATLRGLLRIDPSIRSKAVASVPSAVTNVQAYYQADRTAFEKHLVQALFPEGVTGLDLTAQQWQEIQCIADQRYRTWEWNFAMSPAFVAERDGNCVQVVRGVVTQSQQQQQIGMRYEDLFLEEKV